MIEFNNTNDFDVEANIWYPSTTAYAERPEVGTLGETNKRIFRNRNGPTAQLEQICQIVEQLESVVFDLKGIRTP